MSSSSRSPDLPPDPDPTPPDPPTADTYPVHQIDHNGVTRYILRIPKEGNLPFAYICNSFLVEGVINIDDEDVNQGAIAKDSLFDVFVTIAERVLQFLGQNRSIRTSLAAYLTSGTILEPTFDGVDSFKLLDDKRKHPHIMLAYLVTVPIYHGHVLDPEDVELMEAIKSNGYTYLVQELKKKKKKKKRKSSVGGNKDVLDKNWTRIDQFLNQHSPHSVSCLTNKLKPGVIVLFYWKRKFCNITNHGGTLYVFDTDASCILNEVVWQRLTVITNLEDPYKHIFFDGRFSQIGQDKLQILERHLHGNDDGNTNTSNKKFVEIIVQYGQDFVEKGLATQVTDSIKRNTRLVAEFDWQLFSPPMPIIIKDHLQVYSICGQTVPKTEDCLKDLRCIKGSVLSLVNAFLQKAEVSEQVEHEYIVPLMKTILAQEDVPIEFEILSTTVVQKCKLIDQLFQFAFASNEVDMLAPNCVYQFSLLTKISTYHFELLAKFPVELVLTKFSQALMENKLTIDDNLYAILEFLENYEKNIKCDNLVGLVLNEKMSIIFSTIATVYRDANSRKENRRISEETLRSFKNAIFKLVEAFLEKAEGFKDLEDSFVIPFMQDAVTGYMQDASDQMTPEFLSLSKIIIKKCSEIHLIFGTLFNCSNKLTAYEQHHAYFFLLLGEACDCSRVVTQPPLQQLNSVIEFARWAIYHSKLDIRQSGTVLLLNILKAFEASEFQNDFCREHLLGIVEDVLGVLMVSSHPDLESVYLHLLKQVFNLVDKMSTPIWREDEVPVHYNPIFVREKSAQLVQSISSNMLYSKASKFVDGVYAARNDSSGFFETSRELLIQLKQPDESVYPTSSLSQDEEPSSYPSSFDLTCDEHFKKRLQVFLEKYTEPGCHSPYYMGVVHSMYVTGFNKLRISFRHLVAYDGSLAIDLVKHYTRFKHLISAAMSAYISEMKIQLDKLFKESNPTLSTASLCVEPMVSIDDMPQSMAIFVDFIRLSGNEVTKMQNIFSGPRSVDVESKTEFGLLALCSYLKEMCECHASGDSWDGKFTISDFKVYDCTVFKISAATCGYSNCVTEGNDFNQFATVFLPLYGKSAFVQVLATDLKSYALEGVCPQTAKQFRFRMMTHLAGKNPVLRALIFVDVFRAFRLLNRNRKNSMSTTFPSMLQHWRPRAKDNWILKRLYNHKRVDHVFLEELKKMKQKEATDPEEEEEISDKKLEALGQELKRMALQSEAEVEQENQVNEEESVEATQEFHGLENHGDSNYSDSLASFVDYVRHGISHLGDPNNAGYSTIIKKLIELEMLLSHFLSEEMTEVLSQILQNQIPEEMIEMIEETWEVYARLESGAKYSEPLGLRDFSC